MALLAAHTPDHPDLTPGDIDGTETCVRAVVAYYPVMDLFAYLSFNDYPSRSLGFIELTGPQKVVPGILGSTPHGMLQQFDLMAPIAHAGTQSPSTLLLAADQDAPLALSLSSLPPLAA